MEVHVLPETIKVINVLFRSTFNQDLVTHILNKYYSQILFVIL
jgi:hypothetical protein